MSSPTILIADDDASIRTAVRVCLQADGYVVHEARNGREAMDRIMHDPPDLALLDLAMPLMDGMAVLAQMRSLWERYPTRIIVMTAQGSIRIATQAMQLGASDFLEKPFTPEDLRLSVASVLEARNVERAEPPSPPPPGPV
jgi:DNA-binding NtrC family response regulator